LFAVRRSRKVDLIPGHRQQHLPRTAELAKPGENQVDGFLDPSIGIKAEPNLAMLDVADRHADPQLATPRLGASGVEHAGAQHTELELADAAFKAEEQPIIRPTGVVNTVEVDHASLHQAAQLQQVVPIASIPREAGRVEAQHCADLSATKPRNQLFEAGPCHQAAGGTAEVLVDHFDLAEAALPRNIDELILASLALQIALDLRLGGLPNINPRLARQHRSGQLSARHPLSPPLRRRPPPTTDWPLERARCCVRRGSYLAA